MYCGGHQATTARDLSTEWIQFATLPMLNAISASPCLDVCAPHSAAHGDQGEAGFRAGESGRAGRRGAGGRRGPAHGDRTAEAAEATRRPADGGPCRGAAAAA